MFCSIEPSILDTVQTSIVAESANTMESQLVLGFKEATSSNAFVEGNSKLVPWINWDDWNFVRESLFSSSPCSTDLGLKRISAWRSRGCLPVIIEVTASIIEIQQKDSYFREGLSESEAEDMLTMLYCMTIMRLVNGIVEKTRKKNEVSIGEAAEVIGIPRMLIDIRHECSHRDLPSLRLVRRASTTALDWLKAYYWEPQKMAIPCPRDRTAAKEIKSKIRELAFCLDVKQTTKSRSSIKAKRIKHYEHLCGSGKFLSFMAAKIHSSKSSGSRKHVNKTLKNVLRLYSSFPSEFVTILIEFLLKAGESADAAEPINGSQVINSGAYNTRVDDWKPLIMKLSNKEPEMLLSLLKAVLKKIEAWEAHKHESGGEHLKLVNHSGIDETKHLSWLFEWLVRNLKDLMPSRRKITPTEGAFSPKEKVLPKSTLVNLLHKCLTVSSLGDHNLASAASILAQTVGNHTLVQKLNKLASLHTSNTCPTDGITPTDSESFYKQQEIFISQASKNLEFLKQKLSQKSNFKTNEKKMNKRWSVAKSWKPCPIGMLPSDIGSSGLIPVLDIHRDQEEFKNSEECNEKLEVNKSCGKREAESPLGSLDDSNVKKHKRNGCIDEEDRSLEGVNNRLMIGGVWRRVTQEELISMASGIKILV